MGNSPPIRGMGGWATATAIAARKRWRRCSTYARPVSGAVVCHKSSEEDFSQNQPLQKQGWKKEQIERNEAWLKCMICLVF